MNTAKLVMTIEVHSDRLVIVRDPVAGFQSCCNAKQLWDAVHGKEAIKKPPVRFETTEEYLARGGVITECKFPPPPTPQPQPEAAPKPQPKVNIKQLTLADLGF